MFKTHLFYYSDMLIKIEIITLKISSFSKFTYKNSENHKNPILAKNICIFNLLKFISSLF